MVFIITTLSGTKYYWKHIFAMGFDCNGNCARHKLVKLIIKAYNNE